MDPVEIQGDAFSEYFLRNLMWQDRKLAPALDEAGARQRHRTAAETLRLAQRNLQERRAARSTYSLLLAPFAHLLDWHLGAESTVATGEGDERAGYPVLGPDGKVLSSILALPPDVNMDAAPEGRHRRFSPTLSLVRVLEEQGLNHGLLLNAYRLRLVRRAEGFVASWVDFDLSALAEGTDIGFEVWRTIWGLLRQDAWAQTPTVLEQVVTLGRDHAARVSIGLGQQVQQSVVAFIQGLLSHPANQGRVEGPPSRAQLDELYQQSLRILYRVLFALYAEDRGLLPVDIPTYREGYSLRRLSRWIRDAQTDPRRNPTVGGRFVESSLRALFDLLRLGANLGPEGRIPMYGGGLFDGEQTELVDSLAWGESICAEVIARMTYVPAGPRGQEVHLSYRELDVEQLGSVYESLLEQSVDYAAEPMWRIRLDDRFYVVTDAQRQDLAARRGEVISSELEALLAAEEEKEEDEDPDAGDEPDEEDEETDDEEAPRASRKPVRVLARIEPGTVYLRTGMGRKQTGSYYTNRAFVDFLVRRTCDPLAEGKSAEEILALKVVDPAMGSGHFLVGACRRLSEHLLAAYHQMDPEDVPQEMTRVWQDEERALAACRLLVAGHCIYGVDKNPLAVDLARVSLWLATAAADHPLTFLDHRLRVGDSLLGMKADDLLRPWAPLLTKSKKATKKSHSIFPLVGRSLVLEELYEGAGRQLRERLRRAFASLKRIRELADERPEDLAVHRFAHQAMQAELEPFWDLHCLRIGLAFVDDPDPEVINAWLRCLGTLGHLDDATLAQGAAGWQKGRHLTAFCWDLAFPDVWFNEEGMPEENGGFDVAIGNPPWEKVKPDRKEFYGAFDPAIRDLQGRSLRARIAEISASIPPAAEGYASYVEEQRAYADALLRGGVFVCQQCKVAGKTTGGDPDLFRFFAELAHAILGQKGRAGLLLPAALLTTEGCTGLRRLLIQNGRVDTICRFDNERRLFPGTDHRYRFILLVFQKGRVRQSFPVYFFNWETPDVLLRLDTDRRRVEFRLTDVTLLSPDGLAIPDFRSSLEVQIASRLHEVLTAGKAATALHGSFASELHMAQDSSLFRTRDWLVAHACDEMDGNWYSPPAAWYEERGFLARGEHYVRPDEADDDNAQPVKPNETYVPLFEGRMIHQFDHAAKAYVSGEAGRSLWRDLSFRDKGLVPHYFVAYSDFVRLAPGRNVCRPSFSDVSSQTNERTLLAAVIPGSAAAGHTVPTVTVDGNDGPTALVWVAVANSFCVDWLMRLRSTGHMSFFLFDQLPSPAVCREDPRFATLACDATRLTCFTRHMSDLWNEVALFYPDEMEAPWRPELAATDLRSRSRLRSEIDAIVAHLYGLSIEEFAYILTAFPVLDRSQPALPGDVFIRQTNKGERVQARSYITRDSALLEYCRYKGVASPQDIVAFYANIGVDISRQTGPVRNLEERVAEATRLGAIAYVPTPTRRRSDQPAKGGS